MTGARADGDVLEGSGRPDPNMRPCRDCGHVWFKGERRHEFVEPVDGPSENAEVLCVLCHVRRGRAREDDV